GEGVSRSSARTDVATPVGARPDAVRASGEGDPADRVGVVGDFPTEALGVGEVAAVTAPIAPYGVVHDRAGGAGRVEDGVDFLGRADVVREREGEGSAPGHLSDLGARRRL